MAIKAYEYNKTRLFSINIDVHGPTELKRNSNKPYLALSFVHSDAFAMKRLFDNLVLFSWN